MSPATRLREVQWRDLTALAALEAVAFPQDAWPEATFWAELAHRPRRTYVLVEALVPDGAERLVGYAGLDVAGEVADVMTLAVDPGHRGGGVGRRLLAEMHTRAREGGATSVLLEVRADNTGARALYDANGYAVVHTRRGYYRSAAGPAVDALVMRKELT